MSNIVPQNEVQRIGAGQYWRRVLRSAIKESQIFSWSGLVVGCGLSLVLGIAAASIWKQDYRDVRAMTLYILAAFGAVAIVAVVVELIRAAPRLEREASQRAEETILSLKSKVDELEQNKPSLIGNIGQAIWAATDDLIDGEHMNFVAFPMEVVNRGGDSILRGWRATFDIGGVVKDAPLLHASELRVAVRGQNLLVTPDDSIVERCFSVPIRRGEARSGWVMFGFPHTDQVAIQTAHVKVFCCDYLGNEFVTEFRGNGQEEPLRHVPGSGGKAITGPVDQPGQKRRK
jgi:hypothetical protein